MHFDKLISQPLRDNRPHVQQLGRAQRRAFSHAVPFRETAAAARRHGVLRDEHRMPGSRAQSF
jgi:hypothetical protein